MFKRVFKKLNLNYRNAYEDFKIPYILKNYENLSERYKFVKDILKIINALGVNKFLIYLLKLTKMYPTLWYIVWKNRN